MLTLMFHSTDKANEVKVNN